jgi:glutaminyl-tRNA synthetase
MKENNIDEKSEKTNFIHTIIEEDLRNASSDKKVHTRFPPEPNGYLHIGHAKSITLNFTTAAKFAGSCNLRFDDTNPCKEEAEYVESIKKDVRWLGFDWQDRLFYASDYFEKLYCYAQELIKKNKAYVCHLNVEEVRNTRGTLTKPGINSPYRDRSIEENLDLFKQMRLGKFSEGECTLRAKIDMSSPNLTMRDPALYRIRHQKHHRTKESWCIYPMYDFAHCLCDSLEGITHSICTLEFENHRPLYDWILNELELSSHPRQIEFARLNLTYTIMSKRKLQILVEERQVTAWDDPRMPTLSGLRRRGYTPAAIGNFCERIGVNKMNSVVDFSLLEHFIREDLNQSSKRVMAVLRPLKVTITNYPDGKIEELEAINNPEDDSAGSRLIPFCKDLYIEHDDFRLEAPRKFFRLSPGKEVRLKHAYYITCQETVKDAEGNVVELLCTYDPQSRGGGTSDNRKVKGTLHWVSQPHAIPAQVRLYQPLFLKPVPGETTGNFLDDINPNSAQTLENCQIEPSLSTAKAGEKFQFLRQGYFCLDPDSTKDNLIFNRTVSLKDSWAKIERLENNNP